MDTGVGGVDEGVVRRDEKGLMIGGEGLVWEMGGTHPLDSYLWVLEPLHELWI